MTSAPAAATAADTALPHRESLRTFLRGRFGNLRTAFDALDGHSVGQVTSDDFIKSLQRLGWEGDVKAVFHQLDKAQTGLIDARAFVEGIGGLEEEETSATVRTLSSCRSLDSEQLSSTQKGGQSAWTSARIPRLGSDSQLARPPRHRKLSRGSQGPSMPEAQKDDRAPQPATSPTSTRDSDAPSEELAARLARMEEQLQASQTNERSVAEQLDALRNRIVEESAQRQVDSTSLRALLEVARSDARQAGSDVAELRSDVMEKLDLDASRPDCPESSTASILAAKLEELSVQVTARLDTLESKGIDLDVTQEVRQVESSGGQNMEDEVRELRNFSQSVKTQMDEVAKQLSTLQHSLVNGELQDALRHSEELVQRQIEDLRAEVNATRDHLALSERSRDQGVLHAEMEGFVRTKLDALRDELAVSFEEERARGFAQAEDVDRALGAELEQSIAARAIAEAQAEARNVARGEIEKLRSEPATPSELLQAGSEGGRASDDQVKRFMVTLAQLGQELEVLSANEAGTRRHVTLLQKDFDGFPSKLRSIVSPDLTDLHTRLSKLEHDRPLNARTERSGCSSSGGHADDSLRNLVEDRLATFDIGLARVSGELREQAGAIEEVQGKQNELSSDLQGRLRALIAKVNSKCEEGFALTTESDLGRALEDISTPKMARGDSFMAKDAPRLLGSHTPSHSSPKLPIQAGAQPPVSRSQSCGSLWQQQAEAPQLPDAVDTLQALREENLRLREANLEIREQAVQSGAQQHPSKSPPTQGGQDVVASQACPAVRVVAPAAVQTLPPAGPGQRVGVRRLSAYEAPRSPVLRMASHGARTPQMPNRTVPQVVRDVSAPKVVVRR